ncbi:nucleoside phosphatase GDA1/CD39 [Pilobolus umbonatus]|nr:nucleoside phosphatase GDA1/CD39 [Pilobolus umbonatus]
MIDAGSSGSRVHIYKFNNCKDQPELETEVFEMIEPGLSHYKEDPEAAADSLEGLLDLAVDSVPSSKHHCTPVAVMATAGLRLLEGTQSTDILHSVRQRLNDKYPFPIHQIEIMDGMDEGVYAWITVNYLLGNFKHGKTAATFDLGGASTQIVFEPEYAMPGNHTYLLTYGKNSYELYQHSYLGYGLMRAREKIKTEMMKMWEEEENVYHPCLPDGYKETIQYTNRTKTIVGTGAGHAACRGIIEKVFDKQCQSDSCAFDGVYQPSLSDSFNGALYTFSFFYDLTQPLGMPAEFSVRELGELAHRVCHGDLEYLKHTPNSLYVIKNNPNYCLDLSYIHALLRIGYDVPPDRLIRTAKKINDAETGWCLGASIAMINNMKVCKQ